MYRRGIVTRTDPATCRVRVSFPDRDDVESWWLEVVQQGSLRDKAYRLPDIGEHVAVLMDEHGEAGAVLGSIYSAADKPPVASQDKDHITYGDGAVMEYDRAIGIWSVTLPAGGKLQFRVGRSVLEITDTGWKVTTPDVDWTVGG